VVVDMVGGFSSVGNGGNDDEDNDPRGSKEPAYTMVGIQQREEYSFSNVFKILDSC
jgi:hypothetical protein